MDRCVEAGLLAPRDCVTAQLSLVGATAIERSLTEAPGLHLYRGEAPWVASLEGGHRALGGGLTEAMVRFAARYEYARTVEDVLARRSRLLFLDAALAEQVVTAVARLLWAENGVNPRCDEFIALSHQYRTLPT